MNDRDLALFATVARLGGIGRAAEALHTVQSNVTTRLRLLEESLGATLVIRHARGVRLTAAGERLLPYAERVADLMQEAKRAVSEDGTPRGPLRIGSMETTAALRLPDVLLAFTREAPQVDLSIITGSTAELVASVRARALDGAFVAGAHDDVELVSEPIFDERLMLVTAPDVSLADLPRLAETRIVMFKRGCAYRERLERILAKRGLVVSRVLELGALDAIIGCVAAGLGLSLLPRGVVADAAAAGRVALHDLPPEEAAVATCFVRRRDAFISRAMTYFLALSRGATIQTAIAAE
jgi:DNA-binding transcriptional LysR family regulator